MNSTQRPCVICHMTISLDGNPPCTNNKPEEYRLAELKNTDGIIWMHYRRK